MALTGWPGRAPAWPEGQVVARLEAALLVASRLGADRDDGPASDVGTLLAGRAAARGWTRRGQTSAGGRCRLLAASDGWIALALARQADLELVPALIAGTSGAAGSERADASTSCVLDGDDPWDVLERHVGRRPAAAVVAWAQALGVPAARVPANRAAPVAPWSVTTLGAPCRAPAAGGSAPAAGLLVADLSAMWAGPLCAHILGRAGARVVTVEDPARPDGARVGDPVLFDRLHRGHDRVSADLSSPSGREVLRAVVDRADVVVEASRPRALGALGLDPGSFCAARPGRTWVSITGYGRSGARANWVAFGDDAAVAGGLVAWDRRGRPVFCADAVADPVTGLYAAVGALASIAAGGGRLVDCAMATASAYANAGPRCPADHTVARSGDGWAVSHGSVGPAGPIVPPAGSR
jgi:crotonobetainyl-CoA:carnitine CoA-transferase CaiB-like acyl-CoA transferase